MDEEKYTRDIDLIFSDIVRNSPELLDYDPCPRELEEDLSKYPPIGHMAFQGDFDPSYENNLRSIDFCPEDDSN